MFSTQNLRGGLSFLQGFASTPKEESSSLEQEETSLPKESLEDEEQQSTIVSFLGDEINFLEKEIKPQLDQLRGWKGVETTYHNLIRSTLFESRTDGIGHAISTETMKTLLFAFAPYQKERHASTPHKLTALVKALKQEANLKGENPTLIFKKQGKTLFPTGFVRAKMLLSNEAFSEEEEENTQYTIVETLLAAIKQRVVDERDKNFLCEGKSIQDAFKSVLGKQACINHQDNPEKFQEPRKFVMKALITMKDGTVREAVGSFYLFAELCQDGRVLRKALEKFSVETMQAFKEILPSFEEKIDTTKPIELVLIDVYHSCELGVLDKNILKLGKEIEETDRLVVDQDQLHQILMLLFGDDDKGKSIYVDVDLIKKVEHFVETFQEENLNDIGHQEDKNVLIQQTRDFIANSIANALKMVVFELKKIGVTNAQQFLSVVQDESFEEDFVEVTATTFEKRVFAIVEKGRGGLFQDFFLNEECEFLSWFVAQDPNIWGYCRPIQRVLNFTGFLRQVMTSYLRHMVAYAKVNPDEESLLDWKLMMSASYDDDNKTKGKTTKEKSEQKSFREDENEHFSQVRGFSEVKGLSEETELLRVVESKLSKPVPVRNVPIHKQTIVEESPQISMPFAQTAHVQTSPFLSKVPTAPVSTTSFRSEKVMISVKQGLENADLSKQQSIEQRLADLAAFIEQNNKRIETLKKEINQLIRETY